MATAQMALAHPAMAHPALVQGSAHLWQQIGVTLIVGLAALYLLWRYAPAPLKRVLRTQLAAMARGVRWHWLAARIEAQSDTGSSCGTGCGPCQGCGPAKTPAGNEAGVTRNTITPEALKRTIVRPT